MSDHYHHSSVFRIKRDHKVEILRDKLQNTKKNKKS